MYLIIDNSAAAAGTVLTTSAYMASVAPMLPPAQMQATVATMLPPTQMHATAAPMLPPGQMQASVAPMMPAAHSPVMLPPGMIAAAAQPGSLIAPAVPVLRPGMPAPAPPGVIVPSALVGAPQQPPPLAATTPLAASSILAPHGTMLHTVSHMPVSQFVSNPSTALVGGYSAHGGTNGMDRQSVNCLPTDVHISNSLHQDTTGSCCNVNNSAMQQSQHDIHTLPAGAVEQTTDARDTGMLHHGNGVAVCDECASDDVAVQQAVEPSAAPLTAQTAQSAGQLVPAQPAMSQGSADDRYQVNGDLASLNNDPQMSSLSLNDDHLSSPLSVTSQGSVTLNDSSTAALTSASDHDVTKDAVSPAISQSVTTPPGHTTASLSSSSSVKTKAPSWASLLKGTASAANAIVVIGHDDTHSPVPLQKPYVRSAVRDIAAQQAFVSHVSNGEKVKLEVSGLYHRISL